MLTGSLNPDAVRSGKRRGRFGLFQRRARPRVFGEPFEAELVDKAICEHRPHALAWHAWRRMVAAAEAAGLDPSLLQIHSAYRSVAFQQQIWDYRLAERRRTHPHLSEKEARRIQSKWTAIPGTSAHHTGLALDLTLYPLGNRRARRTPELHWLAEHAIRFGFYPYLPEAWHWEYNPPGLVARIADLRRALACGEPFRHLLQCPDPMPIAEPAD